MKAFRLLATRLRLLLAWPRESCRMKTRKEHEA
jgi:hypothetical protein